MWGRKLAPKNSNTESGARSQLSDKTIWRPYDEPVAWKADEIDEVVDYMRGPITMGLKRREREKVYERIIGYLTEYKRLLIEAANPQDGNL